MTTFTTDDRKAATDPIQTAFEKQFPDLIDNHIAFMCFREGYQAALNDITLIPGFGWFK